MARSAVVAQRPGLDPVLILYFSSHIGARVDAWLRNYDHRRANSPWRFYATKETPTRTRRRRNR